MADLRGLHRAIDELRRKVELLERRLGNLPSRLPHVATAGGTGISLEDSEEIDSEGRKLAVWWIRPDKDALDDVEADSPALGYTLDIGLGWVKMGDGEEAEWRPLPGVFDNKAALDAFEVDAPATAYTVDEDNYWGRSGTADDGEWIPLARETGAWS